MPKRKQLKRVKQPVPLSTQELLGVYRLGDFNVDVYMLWNEFGGEFFFAPDKKSLPSLKCGMNWSEWANVETVLVHEALEFLLCTEQCRMRNDDPWGHNHAEYVFHFNHDKFCRVADKLAWFLNACVDDMRKAYKARATKVRLHKKNSKVE